MKKKNKGRMNKRHLGWILWNRFNRKIEREEKRWIEKFYTGK